jgi:hypothetical protein
VLRRIYFPETLFNHILRKQVFAKEISLSDVDKSVRGLFSARTMCLHRGFILAPESAEQERGSNIWVFKGG